MTFNCFAFKDKDIQTDVAIANFEDNDLIIITEYQKIGLLYLVKKDTFHSAEGQEDIYSIHCLLGSEEDPRSAGAVRFLAEKLQISKNTLFSLTLKDFSVPHLHLIAEALEQKKKNISE